MAFFPPTNWTLLDECPNSRLYSTVGTWEEILKQSRDFSLENFIICNLGARNMQPFDHFLTAIGLRKRYKNILENLGSEVEKRNTDAVALLWNMLTKFCCCCFNRKRGWKGKNLCYTEKSIRLAPFPGTTSGVEKLLGWKDASSFQRLRLLSSKHFTSVDPYGSLGPRSFSISPISLSPKSTPGTYKKVFSNLEAYGDTSSRSFQKWNRSLPFTCKN